MQQRSLFPDEFELQQDALQHLQQFRPHLAKDSLQRALRIDARLTNQDALVAAIAWFAQRLAPDAAAPSSSTLAVWFVTATAAQRDGSLDANAADLIERVLARALLAGQPAHEVFADVAQSLPVALLRRCAGGAAIAEDRLALAAALATPDLAERADLWAHHGDLCWRQERLAEANSSYGRALLLGPAEIDLVHLDHAALRELGCSLRAEYGEGFASRWFVGAVLAGVLQVPARNGWLRDEQVDLLLELAPDAWARFAVLWYRDLSLGEAGDIIARRLELADLLPEVFARVMAARQQVPPNGH